MHTAFVWYVMPTADITDDMGCGIDMLTMLHEGEEQALPSGRSIGWKALCSGVKSSVAPCVPLPSACHMSVKVATSHLFISLDRHSTED